MIVRKVEEYLDLRASSLISVEFASSGHIWQQVSFQSLHNTVPSLQFLLLSQKARKQKKSNFKVTHCDEDLAELSILIIAAMIYPPV